MLESSPISRFSSAEITHTFRWANEERGWPHFARQLDIAAFIGHGDLFVRCEVREAVGLSRLGRKRAVVEHVAEVLETTAGGEAGDTIEVQTKSRNFNVRSFPSISLCPSQTFQISRDLLCAHSPSFRRLLAAAKPKKPDLKNVVLSLADLDSDLAERIFHFFHSGQVRGLSEVAGRLYAAASKYGIEELQIRRSLHFLFFTPLIAGCLHFPLG